MRPSQTEPDCSTPLGAPADSKRVLRRRFVIAGIVLTTAAAVHWHRNMGAFVMGTWYSIQAGGRSISVTAAKKRLADKTVLLVDVRSSDEYDVSHLPGARLLPLEDLKHQGWPAGWPKSRTVITYCTIGYRSGVAAKLLDEQGIPARSLSGGILAWILKGGRIVDETGSVPRVHVWSPKFTWLVPPGFEAVSL